MAISNKKWFAPFDAQQIIALDAFQRDPNTHSYTCENGCGKLLVTSNGLKCACGYTQIWSHHHKLKVKKDLTLVMVKIMIFLYTAVYLTLIGMIIWENTHG